MRVRFGSRVFAPRWFTTLVTLLLLALLVSLGRWQLHRADEKRELFSAFAAGAGSTRALAPDTAPLPRYQHVEASGHYDGTHQILLDNMVASGGRAGYFVITPFALDGGRWVLVNRGWVPLGSSREERPEIAVDAAERTIHGRADLLPRPGLRMGNAAPLQPPFPIVANYPTAAEIRAVLKLEPWTRATEAILLDSREPQGFLREWRAPGFGPERHIGYAVQWFGLAATLLVIYVVTNSRA